MKLKQDCKRARRRRLHSRALLGSLVLASASFSACGDDNGSDSAELQAILQDGDLTQIMRSMLTTDPAAPSTTGTGGTTGAAPGRGGSSGSAGAAGTMASAGSVGTGSGTGGATDPVPNRNLPFESQGFWRFDDCNMDRTELQDSAFNFHTAFRSTTAFCRPSILNTGIGFDEDDDLVLVPDQPNFVFSEGFTVAAWVQPTELGGVRTIFRKRLDGTSSFALVENGNNFQIVINLSNGKASDVQAPAKLDTFTHVAATYDGIFLKLYLNGSLAASKRVVGRLADGVGPLLMGNDANKRRISGVIDSVLFDTLPSSAADIAKLTCLPRPSVLSVTPVDPAAVPPGTRVDYDVQIENNSCEDAQFNFNAFTFSFDPSIIVDPSGAFDFVQASTTRHFLFSVFASEDIENFGTFQIGVNAQLSSSFNFEYFNEAVNFSVLDTSTPCTVKPRRELEIRDVSVVDDRIRTGPGGAWSFGKLMENMAPTPDQAPAMVEGMLNSFLTAQTVNGFTLPPRTGIQNILSTLRGPNGQLDLTRPAFRLLAIVNRIDLNDINGDSATTAGEGRFVFGFTPFGGFTNATLIIEYSIPASSKAEILDLANAWHGLRDSAIPFPSEQYNAALQAVTDRFTARGAGGTGRPNGSALGQIRTNDFFSFSGNAWEFREFHLDATTGMLVPATVAQTPDRSFNRTDRLTRFVLANEPAILAEKHAVPLSFENAPFQAGALDAFDFFLWQVPNVNPETSHRFARNTCNGCHTQIVTGGAEFQVRPRFPGSESFISGFLTGATVDDQAACVTRHFNELGRRGRILHDMVCPDEVLPPPQPDTTPIPGCMVSTTGMGGTGGGMGGRSGGPDGGPPPPLPDGGIAGTTGFGGRGPMPTGVGGTTGSGGTGK
jgi:hypothetical protein